MQITKLTATTLFFLFFYLLLEVFKRKYKIHAEYTRKFAHIFSGIAAIFFSSHLSKSEFIFVTFIFLIFFVLSRYKNILKSINVDHRKTYGEIFYPLGLIILAIYLYHLTKLFVVGILVLAIPDAIGGYVGFKRSKKGKSLIGSLVYFCATLLILMISFSFADSILIASLLMLVEFVSPLGLDNLSVPLVYCLLTLSL